jgi:hypothetical protein
MASISVVIPVGKTDTRSLRQSLGGIPSGVQVIIVDDRADEYSEREIAQIKADVRDCTFVPMGDIFQDNKTWGRNVYRGAEACRIGAAAATGEIIGFMDEDMSLTIPEGLELDGHGINDGDSWARIDRLLMQYSNLLVFGTIYDTDFDHSYTARKAVERNIAWSTEDAILHHYHSNWADGMVFLRREFLASFGGYPEGVGHGGQKFDLCRRAMKSGAVVGMFRDLPYLHYGDGNIQRKELHGGIDPGWYSYNSLKVVT